MKISFYALCTQGTKAITRHAKHYSSLFFSPDDIQFGFWYVGDGEHHHDPPHHYAELHQRPGRSSPFQEREKDFLHMKLLETLNKMAAERSRLRKRSSFSNYKELLQPLFADFVVK